MFRKIEFALSKALKRASSAHIPMKVLFLNASIENWLSIFYFQKKNILCTRILFASDRNRWTLKSTLSSERWTLHTECWTVLTMDTIVYTLYTMRMIYTIHKRCKHSYYCMKFSIVELYLRLDWEISLTLSLSRSHWSRNQILDTLNTYTVYIIHEHRAQH